MVARDIACLHRGIGGNSCFDTHTREHGYEEVYASYIVNQATLQAPASCRNSRKICSACRAATTTSILIPTAEVPVTNLVQNILAEAPPLKHCAHTPVWLRKPYSYTDAMQTRHDPPHQFDKVEMADCAPGITPCRTGARCCRTPKTS